ncbi:MAG: L-seryl-tRNA(Sec) selenium transferase [Cyanobacteria bacterium RYN_339]|nr:L-seryl-tRNA(Sec) selenium transferase [Cyanobacteria bacterium RYN_339]
MSDLRGLPAIGTLLEHAAIKPLRASLDVGQLAYVLREEVAAERARRLAGEAPLDVDALAAKAVARVHELLRPRLRRVVNATGVVINTNLGRSPLAPEALERLLDVAGGYSNLEMDLTSGQRGSRYVHVEELLIRLTGAEAAVVVNNCAAAILLITDTFARGREVVVSRGQLVEIGGSFRLPEVLEASGARLVEVGTTNKTYLSDYERAIRPETGVLMLSHTSNFRIVGFTHEVDRRELAALGRQTGVVTAEDLGSGLLVDLSQWQVPTEPTVQDSVAAGLDLVAVSGDKLMGGPQCGIVVGRRDLVERLKANPMLRALRPDKLALAALEGTLRLYLDPASVAERVPIMGMLARDVDDLKLAATLLAGHLQHLDAEVVPGFSAVGGGTLPGVELPTWLVALRVPEIGLDELARRLRTCEPAVVARIANDRLLLDPRTMLADDPALVVEALRKALA